MRVLLAIRVLLLIEEGSCLKITRNHRQVSPLLSLCLSFETMGRRFSNSLEAKLKSANTCLFQSDEMCYLENEAKDSCRLCLFLYLLSLLHFFALLIFSVKDSALLSPLLSLPNPSCHPLPPSRTCLLGVCIWGAPSSPEPFPRSLGSGTEF